MLQEGRRREEMCCEVGRGNLDDLLLENNKYHEDLKKKF